MLAITEFQHRSVDKDLMERALSENRILLTGDKDFGWLVFAGRMDSPGVILIRFPASVRSLLAESVRKLVTEHASQLVGAFVVLRPGAVPPRLFKGNAERQATCPEGCRPKAVLVLPPKPCATKKRGSRQRVPVPLAVGIKGVDHPGRVALRVRDRYVKLRTACASSSCTSKTV